MDSHFSSLNQTRNKNYLNRPRLRNPIWFVRKERTVSISFVMNLWSQVKIIHHPYLSGSRWDAHAGKHLFCEGSPPHEIWTPGAHQGSAYVWPVSAAVADSDGRTSRRSVATGLEKDRSDCPEDWPVSAVEEGWHQDQDHSAAGKCLK